MEFFLNLILDFVIGFIIVFNIISFFKIFRGKYPSVVTLQPIERENTPFQTHEKSIKLEQELIDLGFYLLGFSVLLDQKNNTYVMILRHSINHMFCLCYLNEKTTVFAYEFCLGSLSGKGINIVSDNFPMAFQQVNKELYRIPTNFSPALAYLSICKELKNDVLQVCPDSLDEVLYLISAYLKKDAIYQTEKGFLYKTKTDQAFQKISLKGTLVLLWRTGIPTGLYFSYKEFSKFEKRFIKKQSICQDTT